MKANELGNVAVLLGGRAGLGGAERGCGQAKRAARFDVPRVNRGKW